MEKFDHQEYRDELSDKLKEIRNNPESENPKAEAKEYLEKEKKSNNGIPRNNIGFPYSTYNDYKFAREEHYIDLSNDKYRKNIEKIAKAKEAFVDEDMSGDYKNTEGVLGMAKSHSDSHPSFISSSELYNKNYISDDEKDWEKIDFLSDEEKNKIKDVIKLGLEENEGKINSRDEWILERFRDREFIKALKPECKEELESLQKEKEVLLEKIKENALGMLDCMRSVAVRIVRGVDSNPHHLSYDESRSINEAGSNVLHYFKEYYIPLERLNKKIARLTGQERNFQSDSEIPGVYDGLSYDLTVYDEDK